MAGYGVRLSGGSTFSGTITKDDANNNSNTDVFTAIHSTSGTAAAGIATGKLFRAENTAGTIQDVARISAILTNAAAGSELGRLSFLARNAGAGLGEVVQMGWSSDNLGKIGAYMVDLYPAIPEFYTIAVRPIVGLLFNMDVGTFRGSNRIMIQDNVGNTMVNFDNLNRNTRMQVRFNEKKGADIASANTLTLGNDGNDFTITGVTQINFITTTNWDPGATIKLHFSGVLTLKHNQAGAPANTAPILLKTGVDLATAADMVVELNLQNSKWIQPN